MERTIAEITKYTETPRDTWHGGDPAPYQRPPRSYFPLLGTSSCSTRYVSFKYTIVKQTIPHHFPKFGVLP